MTTLTLNFQPIYNNFIKNRKIQPTKNSQSKTFTPDLVSNSEANDMQLLTILDDSSLRDTLIQKIDSLFFLARNIDLEYGIDNEFWRNLDCLIHEYGYKAIDVLERRLLHSNVDLDAVSSALRYIGKIDQSSSYRRRLTLLINMLSHTSAQVRDGAVLGIAAMDDANAIPYLESAIRCESIPNLREDMKMVLRQLEEL